MDYRELVVQRLLECGCYVVEVLNAQQEKWHSPTTGRVFVVEQPIRSLITANHILSQAGCPSLP